MPTLINMMLTRASFEPDGSCRWVDTREGKQSTWPSLSAWADVWFTEWRTSDYGDASDFIHTACDDAVPGVVDALVALAQAAGGDPTLIAWVAAGPLEDLLSHTDGNGPRMLQEVAEAAQRSPALRKALKAVVLPPQVKARLRELGVQV
jgi:hypothetical protein